MASVKPSNLIYGVDDKINFWLALGLGFQHIFVLTVAFIIPVIIIDEIGGAPEQAENLICMAMIATGISTILQGLNKGPIGSGYLCPLLNGPAFLAVSLMAGKKGGLSLIFGMTLIGGLFEAAFSQIVSKLRSIFPAEVTGTVVLMVGIEVIPFSVPRFLGVDQNHHMPNNISFVVATITFFTIALLSARAKGKFRLYSVLIGIFVGYVLSYIFGILTNEDLKKFIHAPVINFPTFMEYGISFDVALIIPFIIATMSSALKTMGDLTTCQKINDANWKRADMKTISKGILACSIGNMLSGTVGALGQSVASSNIGLSIATGATSRIIGYTTGGILIVMAFIPKLASIFVIMPTPVMGASLVFAACFMILAGIQIITSRMIDARKTFVIGTSIVFGLSVEFEPQIYQNIIPMLKPLFASSLSLATITAVTLNIVLRLGIARRAVLELVIGRDDFETISSFLERQGGLWGARKEVIFKAISTINEFFEITPSMELASDTLKVEALFDEYNLNIYITYSGKPLDLNRKKPTAEELMNDESAFASFAVSMMKAHADKVKTSAINSEKAQINFYFEH